jgi:hypothetical protein
MTGANAWPSCSRLIRSAGGVFGLKNVVQLARISLSAAAPELGAVVDGDTAAGLDGVELPVPLLHAATLTATAHATGSHPRRRNDVRILAPPVEPRPPVSAPAGGFPRDHLGRHRATR